MDKNSEQLELKKILVDLEDEHKHLQVSIGHLENEIKKRVIEIQQLVAERDLEFVRSNLDLHKQANKVNPGSQHKASTSDDCGSVFAKEVELIVSRATKTCEEVYSLIEL